MRTLVRLLAFVLVLVVVAPPPVAITTPHRVPDAKEIQGTWVGLFQRYRGAALIELRPDGTGRCTQTTASDDTTLHRYVVESWSLKNGKLSTRVRAATEGTPALQIEGTAFPEFLDVEMKVSTTGAVRKFRAYRLSDVEAMLERLTQ